MRTWPLVVGALAALVPVVVLTLFVFPSSRPGPATDAVVVLAGEPGVRLPVAVDLARSGAGVLVVSTPDPRPETAEGALCAEPGQLTVICFRPDPSDTRGEAQAVGRLIAQHGWTSVTVVTSTYHVRRAGLLIGRCTDADVDVVAARPDISIGRWAFQIAKEVGGLTEALVRPTC